MNQKGFANMVVIGIVVAILLGVVGYFVLIKQPFGPTQTQQPPPSKETITSTPSQETSTKGTVPPSGTKSVIKTPSSPNKFPSTDAEIKELAENELLKIYNSSKQYPDGFYQENILNTVLSYLSPHDLAPYGPDNLRSFKPFCDSSLAEAQRTFAMYLVANHKYDTSILATQDAISRFFAEHIQDLPLRETEKFFEVRIPRVSETNDKPLLARIDRCTYINRMNQDIPPQSTIYLGEATLGSFGIKPVTLEKAIELVEYLLFIQPRGTKILAVTGSLGGNTAMITVYRADLVSGDWGIPDELVIIKTIYTVGDIVSAREEELRTVEIPGTGGAPEIK